MALEKSCVIPKVLKKFYLVLKDFDIFLCILVLYVFVCCIYIL